MGFLHSLMVDDELVEGVHQWLDALFGVNRNEPIPDGFAQAKVSEQNGKIAEGNVKLGFLLRIRLY